MRFLVVFLTLITVYACSIDSESDDLGVVPIPSNNIEEAVLPYIERFQEEGERRGHSNLAQALNEITVEIVSIPDQGVAGLCNYNSHEPNHISIDREYWNQSSDLGREFVVFHELGHCVLIRDHLEGCTANRFYISIMRSGLGSCRDAYNQNNREYYLDELFSITGDWEFN